MAQAQITVDVVPESFRAALEARLARPILLEHRYLDSVRALHNFQPRADYGGSGKAPPAFQRDGDVAIISIEGALAQKAWSCWAFSGDGYDAILQRVGSALDDASIRSIVLRIDSPGGEVAGCFEAARTIRTMGAMKPIVAFADELCCSAAYALASSADEIVVPDTGVIGSIGVITVVGDRVKANEERGINLRVIRSGKFKATPHPDEPLQAEAIAKVQAEIDALAKIFATDVAMSRPHLVDAEHVLSFEAATFLGAEAVANGIADHVGNLNLALMRARALGEQRRTSRRSASAEQRNTKMESIAKALGLPHDASEADIVLALGARDRDHATATKTIEALTADVASANQRATDAEARADKVEREHVMAQIKDARKWAPSLDAFLASQSTAQLRSWLESAPAVVPGGEIKPPATPPTNDTQLTPELAELAAKGWANLSTREKHQISAHDAKLADRLRREAK